jgi:transposase
MEKSMFFSDYRGLPEEELKKLPLDELARLAHNALEKYFDLHQKLYQDSTNSNRAPSSDSPEAKAKRRIEHESTHSKHGARKQGAQRGHEAVKIPLVELGEDDIVIDCKPDVCAHCGASLEDCSDATPYRRQKYKLEIVRRVTEYRKHRCTCPECGKVTEGVLPEEAQGSVYDSNIVLLIGMLTGLCQVSRRMAQLFVESLCGIPVSVGSVSNLEKELTEASQPMMKEIEETAQRAERGNADETGFGLQDGKQGWLWVLVTPIAVLFRVFVGRGQEYASRLLGKFEGILTSDRWGGYNRYPKEKRQICWAHVLRDFQAMCEGGGDGESIGLGLRKEAKKMFRKHHRFRRWKEEQERRGVKVSLTVLESQLEGIRRRVKLLLEEGVRRGVAKCAGLLKYEEQLWTFTREEGAPPTNNAAERALRPAVVWKKRSYGVESERGARYVESMLSLWATCRCNGVNTVEFLRELIQAHRSKTALPSISNFSTSSEA